MSLVRDQLESFEMERRALMAQNEVAKPGLFLSMLATELDNHM